MSEKELNIQRFLFGIVSGFALFFSHGIIIILRMYAAKPMIRHNFQMKTMKLCL